MYSQIALFAEKNGAEVFINAPMKKYTSFKCGGNASVLIIPDSTDALKKIVDFCLSLNCSKGFFDYIIERNSISTLW